MGEYHLLKMHSVPIARDKYADRLVCYKCGRIFKTDPKVRNCVPIKYLKVPNYKPAQGQVS